VKAGEIEIKDRKSGARETLPIEAGLERTIRSVIDQRVLA
jgi:prolyl-tRNA synthetase